MDVHLNRSVSIIIYKKIYFDNYIILPIIDYVVFDNTSSYFSNKRIKYSVVLTTPLIVDEFEEGADHLTTSL